MSIDFNFFMTLLLTTPNAVVLLVCIGVGGCLCPMNSRMCCTGTASRQFMYSAPTSTLAADDSTALIICNIDYLQYCEQCSIVGRCLHIV